MVAVNIGVNVDRDNLSSVPKLMDFLEESGMKENIHMLQLSPIMPRMGTNPVMAGKSTSCFTCPGTGQTEIFRAMLEMEREIQARGYRLPVRLVHAACGMQQDGGLLVMDPEGCIYTCPAFVGRKEFTVGHIRYQDLGKRHYEFLEHQLSDDCLKCSYLPICAGGCLYNAQVQTGDWRNTICPKSELKLIVAERMKQVYLLRITKGKEGKSNGDNRLPRLAATGSNRTGLLHL